LGNERPASEQPSVDEVIAGLRQLIGRAHEYGLTILGCTISPMGGNTSLPGFDTPAHEAARGALNQWIRTSGAFDGVVDADLALRDPSQPTRCGHAATSASDPEGGCCTRSRKKELPLANRRLNGRDPAGIAHCL
jgi:hypothetical protein